jgi:hypothetical protein
MKSIVKPCLRYGSTLHYIVPARLLAYSVAALLLLVLLSACGAPARAEERILGRWQRVGEPGVGDPLGTLAAEYVEFREDGLLAVLLFDQGPGTFWTTRTGGYAFSDQARIEIKGTCWRGMQSYECLGNYGLVLDGDRLKIFEDSTIGRQVEFRRIAPLGRDAPPVLGPPMPSPTPAN